ncbi:MAG: thermonuclease family protein [Candidatus Poribacteria bacterium]|nr:thermonuclease family protein [Candidatus Poribacteria bacterium]
MSRLLYSILWGVVFLLIAFTLVLCHQCVFGESPLFIDAYNCILSDADVQVYDGDTIKDVRVLLLEQDFEKWQLGEYWPGVHITERGVEIQTDIRIAGIDTPEKRTPTKNADGSPRSQASRQREKAAAAASRQALILMLKSNGNHFSISDPIHGKYAGRTVADVHVNEVDVATYLIQKGHAKFYDGGTKPEWNWGD